MCWEMVTGTGWESKEVSHGCELQTRPCDTTAARGLSSHSPLGNGLFG